MAIEDRHPSETNQAPAPEGADAPAVHASGLSAKGAKRRRLARAGAGATGVLLTLHSQPGMACTYCGLTASAAMSVMGANRAGTAVSHHVQNTTCNGLPPVKWCSGVRWPRGCYPNAAFHNYFTCSSGSEYYKLSCEQVLSGASCDSSRMGQYVMAAYLNVVSGRTNFMTVESLQALWNEWKSKGYYEPMAGQRWYANDIVGYLYGTMD